MKIAQKTAKLTLDTLMSFMTWTSVFVMGVLVSSTLLRIFLASGLKVYHLVHS